MLALILIGCLKAEELPLTLKNNNPVNIKYDTSNDWKGSVYDGEGVFEKFDTPYYGLRAGIVVVMLNIMQTDSAYGFVRRFATEPNEVINSDYVRAIERRLGYKGKIKFKDTLKVLDVVLLFEGGKMSQVFYRRVLENKFK